jgi:ribulose 1,5-bisphosphate carboxylase large subunit-like protein
MMADLNQPNEGQGAAAPGDQAELSALDRIALEAQGMEQDQAEADDKIINGEPEPEPVIDQAGAWGQLAMMAGGILGMALPELRAVYTEEACMAWGGGMAAMSDKYGWDAGETAAKWAPECMLLMTSLPLIVPTVQAIKQRQKAAKARALNNPPASAARAVATQQDAPETPFRPMEQEPGGFSVPT